MEEQKYTQSREEKTKEELCNVASLFENLAFPNTFLEVAVPPLKPI